MERTQYKQEINMTEALMNRINEIISHYPEGKQNQLLPFCTSKMPVPLVDIELQDKVAEILAIKPVEVYEVVSFYTMFNRRPVGKYMFEF
jgi:NADH-quinone oxidoreductase subunit E